MTAESLDVDDPVLDELRDFHGIEPPRYAGIETVSCFNSRWEVEGSRTYGICRDAGSSWFLSIGLTRPHHDAGGRSSPSGTEL